MSFRQWDQPDKGFFHTEKSVLLRASEASARRKCRPVPGGSLDRAVKVFRVFCQSGKAVVEVADERFDPGVGGINAGDILQAHLLNQPLLQRQLGALNAALGLRAVGTDTRQ